MVEWKDEFENEQLEGRRLTGMFDEEASKAVDVPPLTPNDKGTCTERNKRPSDLTSPTLSFGNSSAAEQSGVTSVLKGEKKATRAAASSPNRGGKKDLDWLRLKMHIHLKKMLLFWPVKLAQLLCIAYILILTFSKYPIGLVDPQTGDIIDPSSPENTANGFIYVNGDYRPVVAIGPWQKACLALSRMSAFSLYPMLILIFLTKCKALHSVFIKTPLSMFLVLNNSHELHTYAGHYIAIDVWIHTLFHILRWVDQQNTSLLWEHRTGLSGLIVVASVPFITLPMMFWKRKLSYELRKGLHYLFFLFAVGMCFHVPMSAIPNGGFIAPVMGFCICLYALDATWVYLFMTEKIETTRFQVLSSGVHITMPVSERFQNRSEKGGIGYVCLPWVDHLQWHAFSLFEDPSEPSNRQMLMMKTGDWTTAVHKALQRDTVRPVWLQGPFPSPYNQAEMFDNQILVASGIGITPALSVIRAHKSSRRINLIWAVRCPAMLEFFLEHMYLDHDGWNLIFYTGKEPLVPALEELNTNVRIIKGRPDLKSVIPNIIYGIESEVGLPESYTHREMVQMKRLLIERMHELDNMSGLSNKYKLVELTSFANANGFLFTELIHEIKEENKMRRSANMDNNVIQSAAQVRDEDEQKNDGIEKSFCQEMLREMQEFGKYEYGNNEESEDNEDEDSEAGVKRTPIDQTTQIDRRALLSHCTSPGLSQDRLSSHNQFGSKYRKLSSSSLNHDHNMWKSIGMSLGQSNSDRNVGKLLTSTFKPWERNEKTEAYVRNLDKEHVLPTWGMLYCGGSPPVQKALKQISEEYNISLSIDSFVW